MDITHLKEELNEEQFEAVNACGASLIIAGAGSGKTRVITYRIAHLLDMGVNQSAILALTFTNKAAAEMATRVKDLTHRKLQNLTVSTFHAFGVKVLREDGAAIGLRNNFSIYDETDKIALIKECARDVGLDASVMDAYETAQLFSAVKCGRRTIRGEGDAYRALYKSYNDALRLYNCVDFDDLITLTIELLQNNRDVKKKYNERYHHILVDEFQDTSMLQYKLLTLIMPSDIFINRSTVAGDNSTGTITSDTLTRTIAVVGDDDQSIYSWRGASYKNITDFERDYKARAIMLTHNYRSTKSILAVANNVISHNSARKSKALWTNNDKSAAVDVYCVKDETREAAFITEAIMGLSMEHRIPYSEFGVLMRTNTQSRHIEEALLASNIPYTMSGGTSFFDRKEIRDIISYLRIIANTSDDMSLLRIINTPRRAIGRATIEVITNVARANECSLYDAIKSVLSGEAAIKGVEDKKESSVKQIGLNNDVTSGDASAVNSDDDFFLTSDPEEIPTKKSGGGDNGCNGLLGAAAIDALGDFIMMLDNERKTFFSKGSLSQKVRAMLEDIGYKDYILSECKKSPKAATMRLKNVETYLQSISDYEASNDGSLFSYLNRIALAGRETDTEDGFVNLMTIHASKGLEFRVVFIAGCEEGILPHKHSLEDAVDIGSADAVEDHLSNTLEEERRLFYVAITRAREKLFISCCCERKVRGAPIVCEPSRFLDEIPEELVTIHA